MLEKYVFLKDRFGRKYRINKEDVDEVLAGSEDRLNKGLGGGQPNLILGCFKSIEYDLQHCKKTCRFYSWKCALTLDGFVEKQPLFKEWED